MHIHVFVVEDNFNLAGTVTDYFEATGVVCDHACDGQTGLNLARANHYNVILLDIMLPRINDRQVCRQLCETDLQTPILMLTALDALQDKLDSLDVDADGYLLRPFELPKLLIHLQALSRYCNSQAQRLRVNDLVMGLDGRQANRGNTPLALSPTTWKIPECLMCASPALVTREQLGRNVWGDEPSENSIPNVHMHHLRSTIDKGFAIPLIHTLRSIGFQLERK